MPAYLSKTLMGCRLSRTGCHRDLSSSASLMYVGRCSKEASLMVRMCHFLLVMTINGCE